MDAYILSCKIMDLRITGVQKTILHLHTQFNREIPYDTIDMDFMNENQAAHGDREYGHIFSRLNMERKVVAGILGKMKPFRNRSDHGCVQQLVL